MSALMHVLARAFVDALQAQPEEPYLDTEDDFELFAIDGHCNLVDALEKVFAAAERAGYVLVPLEATEAMISAFYAGEWMEQKPRPSEIWDDMIAARPLPSPPEPSP